MTKKDKDSDDFDIFYRAMKDVKPLRQREKVPLKSKINVKKRTNDLASQMQRPLEVDFDLPYHPTPTVSPEEKISFAANGVSRETLKKMRKGVYAIEARLDLHNMTVKQAQQELIGFLDHCHQEKYRFVLIIHGKGYHSETPVLKNQVNQWLRTFPRILAFCSASQKHGGSGALYVLLSPKEETARE